MVSDMLNMFKPVLRQKLMNVTHRENIVLISATYVYLLYKNVLVHYLKQVFLPKITTYLYLIIIYIIKIELIFEAHHVPEQNISFRTIESGKTN